MRPSKTWIFASILLLFSCGSEEAADVSLEITPSSPVVIKTDFTYFSGDNEVTVSGPWFQAKLNATNNRNDTVTISGLTYSVSYKKGGITVTEDDLSVAVAGCFVLNEITGKEEANGVAVTETIGADAAGGGNCTTFETLFFPSLPEADDKKYSFRLEVQGWVGKTTSATGNFTSDVLTFTTQ